MQKLLESIKNKSFHNTKELQESIVSMICDDTSPIELSQEKLLNALDIEGEFLVLNLHYNDFDDELTTQKIKYKISQALSVIVRYEDDGNSYKNIEKFIKYIYKNSDDKQNSTFGVTRIEKLSEFPITILFSGILPINQLKMTVGVEIDKLIHSDDTYFMPRFQKHRDAISKEVGIPILPILPILDKELGDYQVRLVDLVDERVISEFEVAQALSKETTEIYLLKLFYIYKVLVQDKKASH